MLHHITSTILPLESYQNFVKFLPNFTGKFSEQPKLFIFFMAPITTIATLFNLFPL
jgi:hypothetical protein